MKCNVNGAYVLGSDHVWSLLDVTIERQPNGFFSHIKC